MIRRVYIPAPAPVWRVDSVGDLFAAITLFAMIALVGFASCWEAIQ